MLCYPSPEKLLITTGSTQVMSENISHSLFYINSSHIEKSFTIVLYLHIYSLYLLLILPPFFLTLFSIIPLALLFSPFCVQISLSISPPPPPPPPLLSLSLSLTSFPLCSYALTFFLYCFPFHFLSLSFVLTFSPCTNYYLSLPVL